MPRRGKLNKKVTRAVAKPQVPLPEIYKYLSEKMDIKRETIYDIMNLYWDYCFDQLVLNREIYLPGIGRFWIDDPKPYTYWDEREGKLQHTLTYPIVRFRPVERLKDSLKGEVFRDMKRQYKEYILEQERQADDKEFDLHFRTKKDPKLKSSSQRISKTSDTIQLS